MGGILSESASPGEPTFNQSNNHYDVASYKRICKELGISPWTDFRLPHEKNHGLRVPGSINSAMKVVKKSKET